MRLLDAFRLLKHIDFLLSRTDKKTYQLIGDIGISGAACFRLKPLFIFFHTFLDTKRLHSL